MLSRQLHVHMVIMILLLLLLLSEGCTNRNYIIYVTGEFEPLVMIVRVHQFVHRHSAHTRVALLGPYFKMGMSVDV